MRRPTASRLGRKRALETLTEAGPVSTETIPTIEQDLALQHAALKVAGCEVTRHGLVVDTTLTKATGTAEREAAIAMVEAVPDDGRITLGTDKSDDIQDFVAEMRRLGVQNTRCNCATKSTAEIMSHMAAWISGSSASNVFVTRSIRSGRRATVSGVNQRWRVEGNTARMPPSRAPCPKRWAPGRVRSRGRR